MSGELVLPPEPIRYFDGLLCPLCSTEYLGIPFGFIGTRQQSIRIFDIPTMCQQERLIGVVLYPEAPSWFYYQPERCLVRGDSNFHCAVCHKQVNRLEDFRAVSTMPNNMRRYRFTCSSCRNDTKIRVIVRRMAEDPLPDVLSPEDRPPALTLNKGLPSRNEILDVHDILANLTTVNFGEVSDKKSGRRG